MKQQTPPHKTFAIVPGWNEARYVHAVLTSAKKYVDQVIFVDDCSSDSTLKEARKARVTILAEKCNGGKGKALRDGCDLAMKKGATRMIVLDADGQHDPKEIPHFIKAFSSHDNPDVIFGRRKFDKHMPLTQRIGNWGITFGARLLFWRNMHDCLNGYKAWTTLAYKRLRWKANRYNVESEILARAARSGLTIAEVWTKTIYHDPKKGTTISDGFSIAWNFIKMRFGIYSNK